MSVFRIETAADAQALLTRTPQQWEQAGWQQPLVQWGTPDSARLTPHGLPTLGFPLDTLVT